jgi:TRAP-type C4-dicarboxylate transport system substrate-binding protein
MMVGIALPILINVNTFNRLAPETQKIFKEVGHEVEIMSGDVIVPAWLDKIFKAWRERGIKFIEFDEQEKLKWIAGLDDIPMEWATEVEKLGLPGLKIVQRWQEIGSEMGYKWPRKWAGKK